MSRADDYVRAIRQSRYGPTEVSAGAVSLWLHGPRFVLDLSGPDGELSVAAADGEQSVGADIVRFFTAAADGDSAELPEPSRLVTQQVPSGADTRVREARIEATAGGVVLCVQAEAGSGRASLSTADAARLAQALQDWAASTMTVSWEHARPS